jgi:hypothetical protein
LAVSTDLAVSKAKKNFLQKKNFEKNKKIKKQLQY